MAHRLQIISPFLVMYLEVHMFKIQQKLVKRHYPVIVLQSKRPGKENLETILSFNNFK
jgi:hypothetical protein